MQSSRHDQAALRQRALLEALEPVAAELRLTDVANFVAYIHNEQFANIRDIVDSSVELFFRPGTLSFGGGAEAEIDWNTTPRVALDMEFRHHGIWAAFRLILNGPETLIIVEHLSFTPADRADASAKRMIAALHDARVPSKNH